MNENAAVILNTHRHIAEKRNSWQMLTLEDSLAALEAELPSVESLISIIQGCRKRKSLMYAKRVYLLTCDSGLEMHRQLENYLVPMFVECGSIPIAQKVFVRLGCHNEYSWSSLIQGYMEYGEPQYTFDLFQKMQEDNVHPSRHTFMSLLKACATLNSIERGQAIHSEIAREGFESDAFVGATLIDMYAQCGSLAEAQEVFDELPVRDVVLWTALIGGYAEHGLGEEALKCLEQMKLAGVSPNAVTCVCCLKACGSLRAIDRGREIHAVIAKEGFQRNSYVCSALIDMFVTCGALMEARLVFDQLLIQDVVSWNALIAGYIEHGLSEEALNLLKQMQLEGVSPNAVTYVCSLKACGSLGAICRAQEIHTEIAQEGFEENTFICSTLVDLYAKFGMLVEAQEAFDTLPKREVVSWNALITGYAKHGLGEEVFSCLEQMQQEGISPNAVTFISSLRAFGDIGAVGKGQEVHCEIAKRGVERDPCIPGTLEVLFPDHIHASFSRVNEILVTEMSLANALLDLYGKFGSMEEAQQLFDAMPRRDLVSWTALITGYAQHGETGIVFSLCECMGEEGLEPDGITLVSVLTACSHAGLVNEGQKYFKALSKDSGITPTLDHVNCLIDLLSRAGQISEALAMLEEMPFQPDLVTWSTVLGACRKWGNVELGRQTFEYAMRLDETYDAALSQCTTPMQMPTRGKISRALRL